MGHSSFPLKKFSEVMRVRGVGVYLHWSLILIGCLILLGAFERPAETLTGWAAYYGVLLIHECGHMFVAQRKGCHVYAIELYPIHGLVRYSEPWSRYDDAMIAWGGVAMQALVGLPLVVYISVFGFTRFTPLNVAMGVLGYYSLFVAALNLLPIRPLDGAKAWYVVRVMFQKRESGAPKRNTGWRSYR
jgi:Zn-dependent protease